MRSRDHDFSHRGRSPFADIVDSKFSLEALDETFTKMPNGPFCVRRLFPDPMKMNDFNFALKGFYISDEWQEDAAVSLIFSSLHYLLSHARYT